MPLQITRKRPCLEKGHFDHEGQKSQKRGTSVRFFNFGGILQLLGIRLISVMIDWSAESAD